jgi:hypothetical protein
VKAPFSALTQSQFFYSAFNSAIFDGPVRIYFTQFHESYALKIYFALQDELSPLFSVVKDYSKNSASTVLIMVYPNEEIFLNSFPLLKGSDVKKSIGIGEWEGESVLGVVAEHSDKVIPQITEEVKKSFQNWTLMRVSKLDFEKFEDKAYPISDESLQNPSILDKE